MPRYKHGCSDYPMRRVWKDEGQRKGGGGAEWGMVGGGGGGGRNTEEHTHKG